MIKNFEKLAQRILNGELQGYFVLRDGTHIPSYNLITLDTLDLTFKAEYVYGLKHEYCTTIPYSYTINGRYWNDCVDNEKDIIDFFPNNEEDMKNERTVKLTLEKAQEWYKQGGELREVALQAYSEEELKIKTIDEEIKEHAHQLVNSFSYRNGYTTTERLLTVMGDFVKNIMLDRYNLQEDENV